MTINGFENKIRPICKRSCQGENQGDFEEVAVHQNVHLALLKLGQTLGDVQPQTAALGVAAAVAANEPLHQFIGRKVQLLARNVLNSQNYLVLIRLCLTRNDNIWNHKWKTPSSGVTMAFSLRLERREVEKRIYGVEAPAAHGVRWASMATS